MPAVSAAEIVPGLVVHLDTGKIRSLGGAKTNACLEGDSDRAVVDPHYFLILKVEGDFVTAVPLFSRGKAGSQKLEEGLKAGYPDKWKNAPSFYSKWQHWLIPIDSIVKSSESEESSAGDRRIYAKGKQQKIDYILNFQKKNRCEFRSVG